MRLFTVYEYAEKIKKARVTVRAKIDLYDLKPAGSVKVGNNRVPSQLFKESDLLTLVFHEKRGRPRRKLC